MALPGPEVVLIAALVFIGIVLAALVVVVALFIWRTRASLDAQAKQFEGMMDGLMAEVRSGNLTLTVRAVSVQHMRDMAPASAPTVGYAKPPRPTIDLGPLPDLSEPIRAEDATMPSSREIPGRPVASGREDAFPPSAFPDSDAHTTRTVSGDRWRDGSGRRDEEPLS